MKISEFGIEVARKLRDFLGEGYNIEYKEVTKNNGAIYHAVLIKEKDKALAPTIYLESFYQEYCSGRPFNEQVFEIASFYKNHTVNKAFDTSSFTDFSKACRNLSFKVVNFEKNKKMLMDIPYKKMLDLAMVPICLVNDEALGEGSIVIKNEHLKVWEISFDELWENAFESAPDSAPVFVESLHKTLGPLFPQECYFEALDEILVVSNKQKIHGASAIFYPGMLEKIAYKLGGDFVIIPSSVHETIVIKTSYDTALLSDLPSMVKQVNTTVVSSEEILSENVYYYDTKAKELTIYSA